MRKNFGPFTAGFIKIHDDTDALETNLPRILLDS
jgi:hypothetical protein